MPVLFLKTIRKTSAWNREEFSPERILKTAYLTKSWRPFLFSPGPRGLPKEMQLNHETLLDVSSSWYSPNNAENPSTTYTTFAASADLAVVEVDVETGIRRS